MQTFKYIKLGLGNLPGYGEHPGTVWMFFLIFVGFFVGIANVLPRAFLCSAIMLLVFGPLYLYGAYERGKDFESRNCKALKNLDR